MKFFRILMSFLIALSSVSLVAMQGDTGNGISQLFNTQKDKPKVGTGAASLLKLAKIKKECDDVTYFKNNYLSLKEELKDYKLAWIMHRDAILPRLEALFFGSCQFIVGSICLSEAYKIYNGEQEISSNKANLYFSVFTLAGTTLLHKGYKNWKNLYQWKLVAHKKITNAEGALKELKVYKEAPELR